MKLKPVYLYPAVAVLFGLLYFAFGYLDADLAAERCWFGCALIIIGLSIALPAVRRLLDDWPRLKPEHSVDLAFLQVTLGVVVLAFACVMGGRLDASIARLRDPTPNWLASPDRPASTTTQGNASTR